MKTDTDEQILQNAMIYIRNLFRGNAGGHDAGHTMRVYRMAMRIAETEPAADREIVALAALLHDTDDHKLFRTEGNANARKFLEENHVPEDRILLICDTINSVSFSRNRGKAPVTPEGKIVQDADRLDAMGAVGIARAFSYGGEHGRTMEDSVEHFHEKLLLLKERMNTSAGRALAERRHSFLEMFLRELEAEEVWNKK